MSFLESPTHRLHSKVRSTLLGSSRSVIAPPRPNVVFAVQLTVSVCGCAQGERPHSLPSVWHSTSIAFVLLQYSAWCSDGKNRCTTATSRLTSARVTAHPQGSGVPLVDRVLIRQVRGQAPGTRTIDEQHDRRVVRLAGRGNGSQGAHRSVFHKRSILSFMVTSRSTI